MQQGNEQLPASCIHPWTNRVDLLQICCRGFIQRHKYQTSYSVLAKRAAKQNNVWNRIVRRGRPARRICMFGESLTTVRLAYILLPDILLCCAHAVASDQAMKSVDLGVPMSCIPFRYCLSESVQHPVPASERLIVQTPGGCTGRHACMAGFASNPCVYHQYHL
jgi:hypothetical protein